MTQVPSTDGPRCDVRWPRTAQGRARPAKPRLTCMRAAQINRFGGPRSRTWSTSPTPPQGPVSSYFDSRQDLVIGKHDGVVETFVSSLAARLADEPLWTSLRRAFDYVVDYAEDAELARMAVMDVRPRHRQRLTARCRLRGQPGPAVRTPTPRLLRPATPRADHRIIPCHASPLPGRRAPRPVEA